MKAFSPGPLFSFSLIGLMAAGSLSCSRAQADVEHTLYMAASMTRDFTIGRETHSENGVFRAPDRSSIEHIGFNHPRVDAIAFDPRDPDVFYLAALNGVLGTRDGGESWRILTGWRETEAKDVAVDPHQPDHVYAALPDGIGVSYDRGQHWEYKDQGIRRKYTQTLMFDRSREGRILAGTELGIYRTEDGAETWRRVLATDATVNDIVQSPADPAVFMAATQSDGAWVSRDGGENWYQVPGISDEHTLHRVAFHPDDVQRLVLCGWGIGVLVSEDGGETWEDRTAGLPMDRIWSVAIDPDYPERIYANPYQEALYVSDDFGHTWESFMFAGAQVWDYAFVRER